MIAPITRSINCAFSAIGSCRPFALVVLGAVLSACSTAPVVPEADLQTEAAIDESRALGAAVGNRVVDRAKRVLPLLGVVEVIGEMNALITAIEDWYDALVRTFPTSHEVNFERLDELNLARERATQLVAQLAMREPWNLRSLRELVARTRDGNDALIRYQIDRATLGRLPSDRYSQLFETHNAWREALLHARDDVRRGELEAMLVIPTPPTGPSELSIVRPTIPATVGSDDAVGEGSAESSRPQSILPDEL